jgi:hypothetical protein
MILALIVVLFCDSKCFSRSYKNCTFITPMADIRVTSVIETYQRRLNSRPYFPSTTFGRATLGANDVANKLFLVFLFGNPRGRRSVPARCGANSKQHVYNHRQSLGLGLIPLFDEFLALLDQMK